MGNNRPEKLNQSKGMYSIIDYLHSNRHLVATLANQIFGLPLNKVLERTGQCVPQVILLAMKFILEEGTSLVSPKLCPLCHKFCLIVSNCVP